MCSHSVLEIAYFPWPRAQGLRASTEQLTAIRLNLNGLGRYALMASLSAAKKAKETSAEKRARKAQIAQLQGQAKVAWAILGGVLVLVVIVLVYMTRGSRKSAV